MTRAALSHYLWRWRTGQYGRYLVEDSVWLYARGGNMGPDARADMPLLLPLVALMRLESGGWN